MNELKARSEAPFWRGLSLICAFISKLRSRRAKLLGRTSAALAFESAK